jgi:hypothetical protein
VRDHGPCFGIDFQDRAAAGTRDLDQGLRHRAYRSIERPRLKGCRAVLGEPLSNGRADLLRFTE